MDNVELRLASLDNSEFAYQVKKKAFKKYINQSGGWNEPEQRKQHKRRFETQDFRVISYADKDVGIIALDKKDCLKVNQIMILPEYQGQQIGRQCMYLLMQEAQQLNLPIRLRTMKENPRAFSFYQQLGFVFVGETQTHKLLEWYGN